MLSTLTDPVLIIGVAVGFALPAMAVNSVCRTLRAHSDRLAKQKLKDIKLRLERKSREKRAKQARNNKIKRDNMLARHRLYGTPINDGEDDDIFPPVPAPGPSTSGLTRSYAFHEDFPDLPTHPPLEPVYKHFTSSNPATQKSSMRDPNAPRRRRWWPRHVSFSTTIETRVFIIEEGHRFTPTALYVKSRDERRERFRRGLPAHRDDLLSRIDPVFNLAAAIDDAYCRLVDGPAARMFADWDDPFAAWDGPHDTPAPPPPPPPPVRPHAGAPTRQPRQRTAPPVEIYEYWVPIGPAPDRMPRGHIEEVPERPARREKRAIIDVDAEADADAALPGRPATKRVRFSSREPIFYSPPVSRTSSASSKRAREDDEDSDATATEGSPKRARHAPTASGSGFSRATIRLALPAPPARPPTDDDLRALTFNAFHGHPQPPRPLSRSSSSSWSTTAPCGSGRSSSSAWSTTATCGGSVRSSPTRVSRGSSPRRLSPTGRGPPARVLPPSPHRAATIVRPRHLQPAMAAAPAAAGGRQL